MYSQKTISQKIKSTIKILPIKSMGEIKRVLNTYKLTREDFMLQLTAQEKKDLALLEKSGDFGTIDTYAQPGNEYSHLSDVDLLAHLESEGDFSSTDRPYNGPEFIAQTNDDTFIIIQAKRR